MALIARGGGDFKPAPEGLHEAVCVDVVDKGVKENSFGGSAHKISIVWEINSLMDDGRNFTVSNWYTLSLHPKANLHKVLKAWRGKPFTPEELNGFDLEKVIGAPCRVVVEHSEKEGRTYANVTTVMKADRNNIMKPSGNYIRMQDREDYIPPTPAAPERVEEIHEEEAEEEIPF